MFQIHQPQQIDAVNKEYCGDAFLRFVEESCIPFQSEMEHLLLRPIDIFLEAKQLADYILHEGERTPVDTLWHREYNRLRELVVQCDGSEIKKATCIILTIVGIMGTTSKWSFYNTELFIRILQSLNEEYSGASDIYDRIIDVADEHEETLAGWLDKFLPERKNYPAISDACRSFFVSHYTVFLENNKREKVELPVEKLMHNIYDNCTSWTPEDSSSKVKWRTLYNILKAKKYLNVLDRDKYADFVKYVVRYCFDKTPENYNDSIGKCEAPSQISEIENKEEKEVFKRIFDFS